VVIGGVVFDIDDTLYFEHMYVRSGFTHVAALAAGSEAEARSLVDWLGTAFDAGVRGDTFDRLVAAFPALAERVSAAELVDAYRRHRPVISLAPGVESVLETLRERGLRLGILSDGPIESQAAKSEALGLDRWFDPIVLTASLGSGAAKPATTGFEAIAKEWGIPHHEMSYIADNPEKDFVGPRKLGWLTIRLRQPEQLRFALEPPNAAFGAELEIRRPDDLLRCLELRRSR
jgi:putative hydrolase of the HAD superfamily